jgi:hypothetical protein
LIGLHANQRRQTEIIVATESCNDRWDIYPRHHFINRFDVYSDIWTEHISARAIER